MSVALTFLGERCSHHPQSGCVDGLAEPGKGYVLQGDIAVLALGRVVEGDMVAVGVDRAGQDSVEFSRSSSPGNGLQA